MGRRTRHPLRDSWLEFTDKEGSAYWFNFFSSDISFSLPNTSQELSSTKIQSVFRAHIVRLRVRALMMTGGGGGVVSAAAIEERRARAQKRLLQKRAAGASVICYAWRCVCSKRALQQLKRARAAAEARLKREDDAKKQKSLARIQCAVRQRTARALFKLQKQEHAGTMIALARKKLETLAAAASAEAEARAEAEAAAAWAAAVAAKQQEELAAAEALAEEERRAAAAVAAALEELAAQEAAAAAAAQRTQTTRLHVVGNVWEE